MRGEAGILEARVVSGQVGATAPQHVEDGGGGYDAAIGPQLTLEKERHGCAHLALVMVVGGDERDRVAVLGVPSDDGGDDGEQLRGHGNDAFTVGL